jgi:hypothetical protein
MADAPNYGAEEKIGHSGRDDNPGRGEPKSTGRNACAANLVSWRSAGLLIYSQYWETQELA